MLLRRRRRKLGRGWVDQKPNGSRLSCKEQLVHVFASAAGQGRAGQGRLRPAGKAETKAVVRGMKRVECFKMVGRTSLASMQGLHLGFSLLYCWVAVVEVVGKRACRHGRTRRLDGGWDCGIVYL